MLGRFITSCEDSLTASVFSHLLHLPTEIFWQILRHACYTERLPADPGEPFQVDFWPKWDPTGTINSSHVEPDLFMRFPSFDLIIEAKRRDEVMQSHEQWERELIAYTNEYGAQKSPVKIIALGGVHTEEDDELTCQWRDSSVEVEGPDTHLFVCPVHMCRWSGLLLECQRMERELGKLRFQSSQTRAYQRILADLIHLFATHGFQTGKWFSDLASRLPRLGVSLRPQHWALQNVSFQLT